MKRTIGPAAVAAFLLSACNGAAPLQNVTGNWTTTATFSGAAVPHVLPLGTVTLHQTSTPFPGSFTGSDTTALLLNPLTLEGNVAGKWMNYLDADGKKLYNCTGEFSNSSSYTGTCKYAANGQEAFKLSMTKN